MTKAIDARALAEAVQDAVYDAVRDTGLYPSASDLPDVDLDAVIARVALAEPVCFVKSCEIEWDLMKETGNAVVLRISRTADRVRKIPLYAAPVVAAPHWRNGND